MVFPLMAAVAGGSALASLFGGMNASKKAKKANAAQLAMQQQALDYQKAQGEKAQQLLMPASQYQPALSKLQALNGLSGPQAQQDAFGAFQTTPGYEWQKNQALEAATRGAAARGGAMSGRTTAALASLGDGMAANEFGNYYSRLNNLYGSQLGAAGQLAEQYTNQGSSLAALMAGMGETRANGIINQGNAWTNALQGITGNLGYAAGEISQRRVDPTRSSYGVY